jgi:L-ascorbate metabolism protein UlaG (beta-lactamase superfamily)
MPDVITLTFAGHSTMLVESVSSSEKTQLLCDPLLVSRVSLLGRRTLLGVPLEKLNHPDIITISHAHTTFQA